MPVKQRDATREMQAPTLMMTPALGCLRANLKLLLTLLRNKGCRLESTLGPKDQADKQSSCLLVAFLFGNNDKYFFHLQDGKLLVNQMLTKHTYR